MYWRLSTVKQVSLQLRLPSTSKVAAMSPTSSAGGSIDTTTSGSPSQHGASPSSTRRQRSSTISTTSRLSLPLQSHPHPPLARASLSGPNGDIAAALNSHDGKGVSRIAAVSDLHASPRRQVEVSHLLAQCACSSDGEYLAGITTTNTVYLWSLKPFSLLSALEYDYIEEFGRMVDLYWRPNSRSLYIVMSKGVVYELYVYDLDEPVMQFAFTTPHHFALGVGESEEVVGKGIGQLRTLRLPEGTRAVCGTAAASLMLVISEQHARYLTWEGMSEATIAVQDVLGSPLAWVVQAVPTGCGGGGEQTVWVSSDGRAYVVTLSRASEGGVSFVELPSSAGGFTSASYSPQLRLLALGSSSGHITMFATDSDGGSEYLFTRPVDPYRAAGGEPVVSLAWTRDGLALAVGLRSGKVAVLSSSGTLLNTTELKGPGGEYTSNFVPVQLHWNAGSTELFALGSLMLGNGAQVSQRGFVLPFARSMAATMMCEGNHRTVSLLSDSSIYLYDCDFGALDDNSQLDLCWHVSQIPLAYISDNWPIKYAVVNLEGTRVAIAGKHGLAHYSLETQKWHLFQSQAQERLLQCEGGLVWFGSFMVASMTRFDVDGGEAQDSLAAGTGGPPGPDRLGARSAAGQHQIIIFAADAPLDLEQAQTTMTLPSRVVTMSIAGSLLLVYCEDGYLRQFYLFEDRGIINASLRQPLCLDGRLVLGDPHMVRSIQCLPSALFDINPSLVVHEGRHLSLLTDLLLVGEGELDSGGQSDSRSDGDGQTPGRSAAGHQLCSHAESSLASGINFGSVHSILWWFSGQTMEAVMTSLNDFLRGPDICTLEDASKQVKLDLEFFPVAVSPEKGIVIGIDQEWLLVDRGIVGVSKLSVKAKLFVHSILDHMLGDDAGHDALMYASCFEHLPYFPHCLEVLLHTVLEREADALPRVSGGQVILPKVIELLQNFDGFLDVVTRCARKTEMSLWPRLFAVVGGPLACFERCLEMGHLRTATQLLIVVYNLEPDTTACRRAVLRLLDMAVARQDRDLCVELARFLQQSAESDKPGNNGDKSPLLELFQTLQAMPAL